MRKSKRRSTAASTRSKQRVGQLVVRQCPQLKHQQEANSTCEFNTTTGQSAAALNDTTSSVLDVLPPKPTITDTTHYTHDELQAMTRENPRTFLRRCYELPLLAHFFAGVFDNVEGLIPQSLCRLPCSELEEAFVMDLSKEARSTVLTDMLQFFAKGCAQRSTKCK